ncbi:hypothetical protein SBA4_6090009 [Candidatus Sulfopaludibacter sp. SbA4]|nr:hypothetical protein SBA4_6090009 [Candidatus Sulfopaludibacter sp. SbA4]
MWRRFGDRSPAANTAPLLAKARDGVPSGPGSDQSHDRKGVEVLKQAQNKMDGSQAPAGSL